jgi:hypothetical protein
MADFTRLQLDLPELREMLVAYLDGELDADDARQVEQLMARDPRVEQELRQLGQTWDLLDRLPRAEVAPSFTRSTVEMVALAVEDELKPKGDNRCARGVTWGGVLAVACLAGYFGARLWPDANRQLLNDLPVIEVLEAYRQTPHIDFLRQLAQSDVFGNEVVRTIADSFVERKRQLASLSPEEKDELHRKYERFAHLPADEQSRLRKLQAAVADDSEAQRLEATLAAYQQWLEKLPGVERAELMALDSERRLERIKRVRAEEARRLNTADVSIFVSWFETQFLQRLPAPRSQQLQKQLAGQPEGKRREVLGIALAQWRSQVERNPQRAAGGRRPVVVMAELLTTAAGSDLRGQLSPHGQQQLDEAKTQQQRLRLMQTWASQVFQQRGAQLSLPDVDDDDLKRFFERGLNPAERARLLNMPAEQMKRQLLLRYHDKRAAEKRQQP